MERFDNPELGREIREIRGKTSQKEFAKQIGASQGQVSKYEKGQMPDPIILFRISQIGNTTVEKLLSLKLEKENGGKPEKKNGASIKEVEINPYVSDLNKDFVKLHAYRVTGAGNEMTHVEYESVGTIAVPKALYSRHLIPMKVVGDYMEHLIMDGSFILVDRTPLQQLIDKKVYCFRIPYAGFITRRVHTEPDGLYLEPYNKQYETRYLNWEDFNPDCVIGRVVYNVINPLR